MSDALNGFAGYRRRRPPYEEGGQLVFPVRPKVTHGVASKGAVVHMIEQAAGCSEADKIRYAARWLCGGSSTNVTLLPSADLPGAAVCKHCPAGAAGIFVYCCRAQGGVPLYAGVTTCIGGRLKCHSYGAAWWPHVTEVTRKQYNTVAEARAAERELIRSENPKYNRQWNEVAT